MMIHSTSRTIAPMTIQVVTVEDIWAAPRKAKVMVWPAPIYGVGGPEGSGRGGGWCPNWSFRADVAVQGKERVASQDHYHRHAKLPSRLFVEADFPLRG